VEIRAMGSKAVKPSLCVGPRKTSENQRVKSCAWEEPRTVAVRRCEWPECTCSHACAADLYNAGIRTP